MPVVGMRRSTRVFVPKTKGGEGVRVLRSGRRLWVESSDGNLKGSQGGTDTDAWLRLIDNGKGGNGWHRASPEQGAEEMVPDDEESVPNLVIREPSSLDEGGSVNEFFGKVYSRRKRKSSDGECSNFLADDSLGGRDRRANSYGLCYVRRKKRRKLEERSIVVGDLLQHHPLVLSVSVEPCAARSGLFDRLLISMLRQMTVAVVRLEELSAFLTSDPIASVCASHGIHFSWNGQCTKSSGFCKVFGAMDYIPLFTMHFSASPLSFLSLHAKMLLRSVHMSFGLVLHTENISRGDERGAGIDEDLQRISTYGIDIENDVEIITPYPRNSLFGGNGELQDMDVDLAFGIGVAKHACQNQNLQHRVGSATRAAHKRRRRSLSTRRARNPSLLALNEANGSVFPNHVGPKKSILPFQYAVNDGELKNSAAEIKLIKSTPISLSEDIDSVSCSGNILVIESDKCYRDEGARIMLETNDSNEWVLAVKKDGLTKYSIKAPKEIKPSTINRFTHAVIWIAESGWKLEFTHRQEWVIFKELARACAERNLVPPSPVVKTIPVPGVQEVPPEPAADAAGFVRPVSYIKLTDDELSRALSRRAACYDMDSEDERWLSDLNSELCAEHDPSEPVSEEIFELIIDAFEKAMYCRPDDFCDVSAASNVCADLSVVKALHTYWVKKRTEKHGPLLRVFQLHRPRRPPQVIAEPVFRKKRSLKRQMSHVARSGKGKARYVLEAMVVEQNSQEEQIVMLRAQEARAAANRAMEVAVSLRKRAQFLMENADLAIYRAAIALRIADAAQVASSQVAAAHFVEQTD